LASRFLAEHVERRRKPTTAKFYRMAIERHIVPALGKRKVGTLKKTDILKMHSDLSNKPVLANRAVTILGSMLAWGAAVGEVQEGFRPGAGIEKNPEKGRERYLSTEELERLGAALRDAETIGIPWDVDEDSPTAKHVPKNVERRTVLSPHAIAALRLLILLGARLREVLHLRWSEVDFERGLLLLPDSKTGKKTIILNAPALQIIEAIPRVGEYVIAGKPPARGKKERPRSDLKKSWAAVRRHAGLGAVRLHDLRHSFASVGVGANLGLPIVGKLLGHSDAGTTQRYAHLDADPLRRASNAIGATIAAALDGRRPNAGGDERNGD
jgi:integrase